MEEDIEQEEAEAKEVVEEQNVSNWIYRPTLFQLSWVGQ